MDRRDLPAVEQDFRGRVQRMNRSRDNETKDDRRGIRSKMGHRTERASRVRCVRRGMAVQKLCAAHQQDQEDAQNCHVPAEAGAVLLRSIPG